MHTTRTITLFHSIKKKSPGSLTPGNGKRNKSAMGMADLKNQTGKPKIGIYSEMDETTSRRG